MLNEIKAVLYKEIILEWKQKYALNGLLLYVACMIVVITLSFMDKAQVINLSPLTWSVLFWLILLFVAIHVVAKSFIGEQDGQLLYLYGLANPVAVFLAKMLYNSVLLIIIGMISGFFYLLLTQQNVQNTGLFLLTIASGGFALAANMTLVSAIASKAENKNVLLAVLSFPLTIPVLINVIKLTRQALEGFTLADNLNRVLMVTGIGIVLSLVSLILFPFIWRD